ncbi:MBL fold metallo-hydrolase [Bradyrhizobium canariense]|uniref:Glyoxylase, beta-lactamase superfamily II n=1 Tax=Bradyrhizobium canariense TaxID=255045 RepID=A0A1H1NI88_9BRAD|nr:MBL fold metallo-hydrolase [Bradyrhizobium canariense]SDR98648.1 Glyoxylase, beta-lactamase superfamily II [Bradyrhizobium canariense]
MSPEIKPPEIELLFTGLAAEADKFLVGASTVALVRSAGELILFDTGPYAYRPILQGRLRRAGIDPADVSKVVLSHLHWDNAANADLFGNADILVHERELEAAGRAAARDPAIPEYTVRAIRKLRLRPVAAEIELAPDLRIVELPGHTPGSIGLMVGRQLLAGDAVGSAKEAVAGQIASCAGREQEAATSLKKALATSDIIYPGHDRPFRVGPPIAYISDYELRIRLFVDPSGQDEELHFGAAAAKSFATWPGN